MKRRQFSKLYNGTHLKLNKVKTYRARKITAHSDQRVLLDFDGDQPGTLLLSVEMVPRAIDVIAPI